jgi:ABC-2 type transport system permease protein
MIERFAITTCFNIGLCFLFPFIASMSRGILAPVSVSFGALILSQVLGALPIGRYVPWSIPLFYLNKPQLINWISELSIFGVAFIGVCGTVVWWNYADQK